MKKAKQLIYKGQFFEAVNLLESQGKDVSKIKPLIISNDREIRQLIFSNQKMTTERANHWRTVFYGGNGKSGIIMELTKLA